MYKILYNLYIDENKRRREMNENMKIKTYWKPLNMRNFVENETTLAEAIKYNADWVEMVKAGATYIVKDYTGSNPGVMIIIVNVF